MTTARREFEGFSLVLPPGWDDVIDDGTYSDPDGLPPMGFSAEPPLGTIHVWSPLLDEEVDAGSTTEDALALANAWGRDRGCAAPLGVASGVMAAGPGATATFRLGDDFVQVWVIVDGQSRIFASYVCPWQMQDHERAPREALVASLAFA